VNRRCVIMLLVSLAICSVATAGPTAQPASSPAGQLGGLFPDVQTPQGTATIIKWLAAVTVLTLAPAILVMVTSFTRIVVVLGLLRQALATHQLPPNQVLFALALLMTLVIMAPVYRDIQSSAISPYFAGKITRPDALSAADARIRTFMIRQIEGGDNTDDVYLFLPADKGQRQDLTWADVPTLSLLPAFVVSELKIAFLMGFRIFLPFLVIDMLTASVLVSMGMLMLPPVLISLPFKLLLFVLADGWHLVVGTLMTSFN